MSSPYYPHSEDSKPYIDALHGEGTFERWKTANEEYWKARHEPRREWVARKDDLADLRKRLVKELTDSSFGEGCGISATGAEFFVMCIEQLIDAKLARSVR